MKFKDLEKIMDKNDYSWIKVKKFDEQDEASQEYDVLKLHHEKETEFLLSKCRELAEKLQGCMIRLGFCTDEECDETGGLKR